VRWIKSREEASSFLKKRSKKLLILDATASGRRCTRLQGIKVFLLLFLQKKKHLPSPPPCAIAATMPR
jgi:hypothetical protein